MSQIKDSIIIEKAESEKVFFEEMEREMEMENHDCHADPEDSCDCQRVEEIPLMKGTWEALDKLEIK